MPEEASSDQPIDVNTDEGFNRALAAATGKELTSEQVENLQGSDRSVASGLEIPSESKQPKDPETGRFLPKEPVAPKEIPVPAGAAPTEPPADDPLQALIEAHGGDVKAALAAVAEERDNAQSVIGRQGEELGKLRALELEQAKLEGRLEAQSAPAPAQFVPFSQIEAAITEADDPESTAPGVMAWVIENSPEQIDATLNVWKQYDPVGAADFAARKAFYEEQAKFEAERPQAAATPAEDPWVAQKKLNEEMAGALGQALADVPAEEKSALTPYISKVWDKAPAYLKQAMVDPAQRGDALADLVGRARSEFMTDTIAAAKAAGAAPPKVEVVSGANQNPLPPEGGTAAERTPQEVSKALQEALLATDTTSVSSGLTYGKSDSPQQ